MSALLSVRSLCTAVSSGGGDFDVLRGVSFDVAPGEKIGIVGESGSGKSMTALSIVRLLPPAARIKSGMLLFDGEDLAQASSERLRSVRGAKIGMVFQDPMTSLNPVRNIGRQMTEGMEEHLGLASSESRSRALELLRRVKIARPEQIMSSHPHQLSGGMRQRVAIAMALACRPSLVIADEPTTALDVTVQAEVIRLLEDLTSDHGTAVILISHSLDLVAQYCDRVLVMYAGRIVEAGSTTDVIRQPQHPYTADLIASAPDISAPRMNRFAAIAGQPPAPSDLPTGCPYHPRCALAFDRCTQSEPALGEAAARAACWLEGDKTQVRDTVQ
jgi:oligopeptide/dipeptide ABC transporter ATP-binding protein